jgi:hypothetical protein
MGQVFDFQVNAKVKSVGSDLLGPSRPNALRFLVSE